MVEVTIQVSEELSDLLEPLHDRLPELLDRIVNTVSRSDRPLENNFNGESSPVYTEVLDFLISRPTPRDIVVLNI